MLMMVQWTEWIQNREVLVCTDSVTVVLGKGHQRVDKTLYMIFFWQLEMWRGER